MPGGQNGIVGLAYELLLAGATLAHAQDSTDTDHWFELVPTTNTEQLEVIQQYCDSDLGLISPEGVCFGQCKASVSDPPPEMAIGEFIGIIKSAGRSLRSLRESDPQIQLHRFVLITNRSLAPSPYALAKWINEDSGAPLPSSVTWQGRSNGGTLDQFLDFIVQDDDTLKPYCQEIIPRTRYARMDWIGLNRKLRERLELHGVLLEDEISTVVSELLGKLILSALSAEPATRSILNRALTNDGSQPISLTPPELPERVNLCLNRWVARRPERESNPTMATSLERNTEWNQVLEWLEGTNGGKVLALIGKGGRGKSHMLSRIYSTLTTELQTSQAGAILSFPVSLERLPLKNWEVEAANDWIPQNKFKQRLNERIQIALARKGYQQPSFVLIADLDLDPEKAVNILTDALEIVDKLGVSVAFTIRSSHWEQARSIYRWRNDVLAVEMDWLDKTEVKEWLEDRGISWAASQGAQGTQNLLTASSDYIQPPIDPFESDDLSCVIHPVVFSVVRALMISKPEVISAVFMGNDEALTEFARELLNYVTDRITSRAEVSSAQALQAIQITVNEEDFDLSTFRKNAQPGNRIRWQQCLDELESLGICDQVGQGESTRFRLAIPLLKRGVAEA